MIQATSIISILFIVRQGTCSSFGLPQTQPQPHPSSRRATAATTDTRPWPQPQPQMQPHVMQSCVMQPQPHCSDSQAHVSQWRAPRRRGYCVRPTGDAMNQRTVSCLGSPKRLPLPIAHPMAHGPWPMAHGPWPMAAATTTGTVTSHDRGLRSSNRGPQPRGGHGQDCRSRIARCVAMR